MSKTDACGEPKISGDVQARFMDAVQMIIEDAKLVYRYYKDVFRIGYNRRS